MPSMAAMPNKATKPIGGRHAEGGTGNPQCENTASKSHGNDAGREHGVAQAAEIQVEHNTINASDSGTATPRRATASCKLPNSPTHSRRYPPGMDTEDSTAC